MTNEEREFLLAFMQLKPEEVRIWFDNAELEDRERLGDLMTTYAEELRVKAALLDDHAIFSFPDARNVLKKVMQ